MRSIPVLIMFSLLVLPLEVRGQQFPEPTGYVNDFAQVLSYEQGQSLNAELVAFEEKTTVEIAVVTVPSLSNTSVEKFTLGLATEWGVGKEGADNGIVFLIAPNERKMRIETAEGARSVLTDSKADRIRDNVILPNFRNGDMATGIIEGTHAIMRTFNPVSEGVTTDPVPSYGQGNYVPPGYYEPPQKELPREMPRTGSGGDLLVVLGVILAVAAVIFVIFLPVTARIRRAHAQKYVTGNVERIRSAFNRAKQVADHEDVKADTRNDVLHLEETFLPLTSLSQRSRVDWVKQKDTLVSVENSLSDFTEEMQRQISFAEKARREGPALFEKFPEILEDAEKELSEGKESQEAKEYLVKARAEYERARQESSQVGLTNWVLLYMLLNNAQSHVNHAHSAHTEANTVHSASRPLASSPFGFGGRSGFGGGGGFRAGGGGGFRGGGSSGGW